MVRYYPCGCCDTMDKKYLCAEHAIKEIPISEEALHKTAAQEIAKPTKFPELKKVEEVRVVDPKTGGEKGSKLARYDLIPPDALWKLAEVYGEGAKKYADRNWEKGYKWGLSIAALERHLALFKMREDIDEETKCYHMSQVCWHALALLAFQLRGIGTDDRPFGPSS